MPGINILVATSIEPKVVRSAYLPITTEAAQISVTAGTSFKVATATITNVTATAVTVSLSMAPSGVTLNGGQRILNNYVLPANDTLDLSFLKGAMMAQYDYIAGVAGTANAVVLVVTGTVHS